MTMGWLFGVGVVIALAGVALGLVYALPMFVRRRQERAIDRRCRRDGLVALTYDDGPGPTLTPRVLDALDEHGAKATFFLLGMRAVAAPAVIDETKARGHELACHGDTHLHAWKASPARTLADMRAGYAALSSWLAGDALFRPPYGKWTLPTMLDCRRRNSRAAWWTIVSGDTHETLASPESVAARVSASGGGVVLLHDFDRDPSADAAARHDFVVETTRAVLSAAKERNLRVVTMGEAMGTA